MTSVPKTEAACLLESGALYRSRVGLLELPGLSDLAFAGFKQGAFSLYFDDAPIYHFDLEGRWQRAYIGATHYLKSLDTSVHAIDRVREGANLILKRRTYTEAETRALDDQVRSVALDLMDVLDRNQVARREPPAGKAQPLSRDDLREFLARIAGWDSGAWDAHRRQYHATYGPLPFLPPDCQNAVVAQATFDAGRGSGLGKGPASAIVVRSAGEFRQHVEDVVRLLGRRLLQSRMVFLSGGEVLRLHADLVAAYLDVVDRAFGMTGQELALPENARDPLTRKMEVFAFLDDFSPPCPDPAGWRAFRERHLAHVTLGIESGAPRIRERYHKAWRDEDLQGVVSGLKSAGIRLSLLILAGAGGHENAAQHRSETARLLSALELGRGDLVFLLDERELSAGEEEADLHGELPPEEWEEERQALKEALAPLRDRGVKVISYSLEKQWA